MAQFLINFRSGTDGLGDFLSHQLTVPLAEAEYPGFQSGFADAETRGGFCAGNRELLARFKHFQNDTSFRAVPSRIFGAQTLKRLFEDILCPATLEELLGCQVSRDFAGVTLFSEIVI